MQDHHSGPAISDYFAHVEQTFASLRGRCGGEDRSFAVGGGTVRFRFAGSSMVTACTAALAHLPAAVDSTGLEVICWDGAETGTMLPRPPWTWPETVPQDAVFFPHGDATLRVFVPPSSELIILYDAPGDRAIVWMRDAKRLPTYHQASPLLLLFAWWTRWRGVNLLHGGCVGDERGALLLVGKGGSGKSTTCLLAAEAGLHYLSDDYCIVRNDPEPTAFSLYCSGKLHREHLQRFPRLASLARDPNADHFAKPMIFLGADTGHRVVAELPLRAIVVPHISGQKDTTFERGSAAEALRALAPSTLMQLGDRDAGSFQSIAALVKKVPSMRLNLGSDFDAVPVALRALLDRLA